MRVEVMRGFPKTITDALALDKKVEEIAFIFESDESDEDAKPIR